MSARAFWNFKKYQTSFSFCGMRFSVKPGDGCAAVCTSCDFVVYESAVDGSVRHEITEEMLAEVEAHWNTAHAVK